MRHFILSGFLLLTLFSHAQVSFKNIENYGPEIIRSGESVFSVTSDADGKLFFATDKGVLIYDGEKWQVIGLNNELGTRSVEYDSIRDRVWVGGLGTFGYLEKNTLQEYHYISLSDEEYAKKSFKKVWQIYYTPDSVTFTSYEGHFIVKNDIIVRNNITNSLLYVVDGIRYYSERDGKSTIYRNHSLSPIENLPGNIFQVVKLDQDQHLIITQNEGVLVHQLSTGRVFPYQAPLNNLLKKYPIYTTVLIGDNLLVNTTYSHGILITDSKGNMIDQVTMDQGLISNYILDAELDRFGKLWLATDYGVSVVDIRSALPSLSLPKAELPKTMIKFVRADSSIYAPNSGDSMYFNKKPDLLRFRYTLPGLSFISNHQYLVRLDGYDSTWKVAQHHDFDEYFNLPNGQYQFRVKARIDDIDTHEATIYFTINEPWYSWLFDVGPYVFISIGAIALLVLIITYRLQVSRMKLSTLVAEKTRELELREVDLIKMNQSLIEINSELDTFLYRSSHDLISPVKSVQGLISLMKLSKQNNKLEIEHDRFIDLMENRMKRLENILTEISTYVKSSKREPVKSKFMFKDLISEVWAEVEFMEGAKGIDCDIKVDETLQIESDRDRWKMVLSNLITNAIKYSDQKKENPFIHISVKAERNAIKLAVEDNGQGIETKYQNRLFEMFYRATDSSNGTGLGLFLVKKVVDSLKGSIQLESDFQVGTKVQIVVPFNR